MPRTRDKIKAGELDEINPKRPVGRRQQFIQMVPFRPKNGQIPKGADACREYRRAIVSELVLAGLSNREIKDRLNEEADALTQEYGGDWEFLRVSHVTVRSDRIELMNRAQEAQLDNIEHYRTVWHQRLEKALSAIWERVVDGDVWAIDRMLKIAEMDGKLFGLLQQPDAPMMSGDPRTRVLLERLVITIQSMGLNPASTISQLTAGLKSHEYTPPQIEMPVAEDSKLIEEPVEVEYGD